MAVFLAHLCPRPNVKLTDFPDAFAATAAEPHLRANVQGVEVTHSRLYSIELDTRGGLAHIDDPVPAERKRKRGVERRLKGGRWGEGS